MRVHRYIPPHDHPLAPYLQSIWRVQAEGAFSAETILPKGNVDILFNLSHALAVKWKRDDVDLLVGYGAHVVGAQTHAFNSVPQGNFLMLGVSLRVELCGALFPLPLNELTDQAVEGALVLKGAEPLRQRLGETPEFNDQVRLLLNWLLCSISSSDSHSVIQYACNWLREAPADAGIATLAGSLGVSSRHLRRLFLQHVGITPGHYLRLSRFVRSLYLMSSEQSLTEIAHSASYFDQAHFCRDFRDIAGITPGEYRQKVGPVVGHLFHS